MKSWKNAISRIPPALRGQLEQLEPCICGSVQELRLRSGQVPVLVLPSGMMELPGPGTLTHQQLQQCFYSLCGNSVHTYQNDILRGFFTLPGGHRVGVAGLVNQDDSGRVTGLRTVTSLNLRIARNIRTAIPEELYQALLQRSGLLIAGPPGSGKTTLLRSIAYALTEMQCKTAIVDERCELMPCTQQGCVFPMPLHCDVLSGIHKADGILMALRSLSPDFILCDEIGGMDDAAALEQGLSAGAAFVASIHAESPAGLHQRPQFIQLQKMQAFQTVAYLCGAKQPGTVKQVETLW